ncbi:hypothetical protein [Porphyromonas sp. COT-290 OH3588]|uniref:hypothetical protein n=1 Tax=Porphyromonas sp. COT-290 OH3588 TaxID=1515617 RepID=UPI00052BD596|nr:hypothetical protein [Porphyromonas sp. COT-290 OH3588]KGO01695.1 hypothetical protein HQ48_00795 [Porphyromonas sp. COT-290 OH3588]
MSTKSLILLLVLLLGVSKLSSQEYYRAHEPALSSGISREDLLALKLSAEGFFRNNEYASDLVADYTLPGYRLQADLSYTPKTQIPISLRLGATNIYYWGSSLYPAAIAYSDLPYWSGEGGRYTRFRLKPFFQAAITPAEGLAVILGNLEGGAKHELIEPLYNPELNLTADREAGLQIKYINPRSKFDIWVDWRSFIYKHDTHPEAFVFGLHAQHRFAPLDKPSLELRLQALAHHRGGVLNQRPDTVHSWSNATLGLVYMHPLKLGRHTAHWYASLYALGYAQRGGHYPVDKGWGGYIEAGFRWHRWHTRLALWQGYNFISVLGTPFVQSIGRAGREKIHSHTTRYLQLLGSYSILERKQYSLGASAALWYHTHSAHPISSHIEVYLNISPYFGLLKWKP